MNRELNACTATIALLAAAWTLSIPPARAATPREEADQTPATLAADAAASRSVSAHGRSGVLVVNGAAWIDRAGVVKGSLSVGHTDTIRKPAIKALHLVGPTRLDVTPSSRGNKVTVTGRGRLYALVYKPGDPYLRQVSIEGDFVIELFDRGDRAARLDQFIVRAVRLDGRDPDAALLKQTGRCSDPAKPCVVFGRSVISNGDGIEVRDR